jgi:hypothetical protein
MVSTGYDDLDLRLTILYNRQVELEAENRDCKFIIDQQNELLKEAEARDNNYDGWIQSLIIECRARGITNSHKIGELLYTSGAPPLVTVDISESLSLGYGKMDEHGLWEFPAPKEAYNKFSSREGVGDFKIVKSNEEVEE